MSLVLAQGPATNILGMLFSALNTVIAYIPRLIAFLVILLIGYVVAKVVQWVVRKILNKLDTDRRVGESHAGHYLERMSPGASLSRGIGRVAFWLVFAFAAVSAIGALEVPALTAFMNTVLGYLPNVIAAVVVFVLAGLLAGAVGGLARRAMGETPSGKVVATVAPALVMGIATFMILTQLGIAPIIVMITYAALMGALALGLALAFGLGGREVASEMLRAGYDRARTEQAQLRARSAESERQGVRSGAGDTGWRTTAPGRTGEPAEPGGGSDSGRSPQS